MRLAHIVLPSEEGLRLESVLRGSMAISANQLRITKKNGLPILLDGQLSFTNQKVCAGQRVEIELPEYPKNSPENECGNPAANSVRILYEDESLAIAWKSAFLQTHASASHPRGSDTLERRVSLALGRPAHPVHRLDEETSGPVVFAKSPYVQHTLQRAIAEGLWQKEYRAAVYHAPDPPSGMICAPIRRESPDSFTRVTAEDGKEAVTRYNTLIRTECFGETVSLLSLTPLTGRTHQLRVHLSHIGCPILGDKRYASPESGALSKRIGLSRQQLCSVSLSFPHPLGKGTVSVRLDDDLELPFPHARRIGAISAESCFTP